MRKINYLPNKYGEFVLPYFYLEKQISKNYF